MIKTKYYLIIKKHIVTIYNTLYYNKVHIKI